MFVFSVDIKSIFRGGAKSLQKYLSEDVQWKSPRVPNPQRFLLNVGKHEPEQGRPAGIGGPKKRGHVTIEM